MSKEQKKEQVESKVVEVVKENENTENKTEIEVVAEEKQSFFAKAKNGVKKHWKKGAVIAGITAATVGVLKVVKSLRDDENSEDGDYVTYIELNEESTEPENSEDN